MEDNNQEKKINDGIEGLMSMLNTASDKFNGIINHLQPNAPAKIITIEVVEKKGFFGFGRVVKKYKANTYISMNNILCFDFSDKTEMKEYFDSLK